MNYLRFLRKKKIVDNPEQTIQIFDDFSCKEPKILDLSLKGMTSGDLLIYIQKEFENYGSKLNNKNDENQEDNQNFDFFALIKPKKNCGGSYVCRKLNFFELPMNIFLEKDINFDVNLIYYHFNQEFYTNEFNLEKTEVNANPTIFSNAVKKNCKKNGLLGFFKRF